MIYLAYDIGETQSGDYSINAHIPMLRVDTNTTKKINKSINDMFVSKMFSIVKKTDSYTIYNVDYMAYINYDILSLVIRCTLKDAQNPQRLIIQTYNYDIKNDKLLSLEEILNSKSLEKTIVQEKIDSEIKIIKQRTDKMNDEGYNLYTRAIGANIYKIESTETFFLGTQGYLYIIYPYGNNNFTSEKDIIIF